MSKRTPTRGATPARGKADPLAAYLSQALSAHQQGKLADADKLYSFILAKNPQHADALHYAGVVRLQSGQVEAGVSMMEAALRINPKSADILSNLANGLITLKRHAEALVHLDQAIKLLPAKPEAHTNRGIALAALGRHAEALEAQKRAIALRPNFLEALNNLGNAQRALKQYDEAIASYDKALALRANYPEALNNKGLALNALRRYEEAITFFDKAIAARPHYAEAFSNKGNAFKELQRFDEAVSCYTLAVALKPDFAQAHYNRGNTLGAQNRYDDALAAYRDALALEPEHVDSHWNSCLAHLLQGKLEQGWTEYSWRWKLKDAEAPRAFDCAAWQGEPLQGKQIILWAEQGLGDSIQFARYASLLSAQGARVVLEVQAPLESLLARIEGVSSVVARGTAAPAADYHCSLLDLPLRLNTTLASVPARVPYLKPDAAREQAWAARLASARKPRIGLVCSGNPKLANDRNRSIPLAAFASLLNDSASFYMLQKEYRADDLATLSATPQITDLSAELNDFEDTAAVIAQLDLVICVDTSVAHLAGALGKPVWILLPFAPDWRWLLDRTDSPWYPGARLYRQTRIGDWSSLIQRVAADLRVRT